VVCLFPTCFFVDRLLVAAYKFFARLPHFWPAGLLCPQPWRFARVLHSNFALKGDPCSLTASPSWLFFSHPGCAGGLPVFFGFPIFIFLRLLLITTSFALTHPELRTFPPTLTSRNIQQDKISTFLWVLFVPFDKSCFFPSLLVL